MVASFDPTLGQEQQGRRPGIVVTHAAIPFVGLCALKAYSKNHLELCKWLRYFRFRLSVGISTEPTLMIGDREVFHALFSFNLPRRIGTAFQVQKEP